MRTRVWFNLHKKVWSTKVGKARVAHHTSFCLRDVTFRVQENARQKVLAAKVRSVHAYMVGEAVALSAVPADAVPVSYNPYKLGSFYRADTMQPLSGAGAVWFTPNGAFATEVQEMKDDGHTQ